MRPPLSLMPLLPVAVALAIGIIAERTAPTGYGAIICASLAAAAIIGIICRRRNLTLIVLSAAVGSVSALLTDARPVAETLCGRLMTVTADVLTQSESGTSQILTVRVISARDNSGANVSAEGMKASAVYASFTPEIKAGDRISFNARITIPRVDKVLPDERDPTESMRRRGIYLSAFITPDSIIGIGEADGLTMRAAQTRRHLSDILYSSPLKSSTREFLVTALLGDSSAIGDGARADFARAGLAHLLALSGLHVGIIATIILLLLSPLRLSRFRHAGTVIAIALLWIFALVTGLSASVTRSVIMATVMLCAMMLQRRHSPANALCLAAIIILVANPSAIMGISFQLSFLAVAGILVFANRLNPVNPRRRWLYTLTGSVTVTIAAMLATGAVSAYYFHTFPILFIVANVITAPLLAPLLGCGLLVMALGAAGIFPKPLCIVTDILSDAVSAISRTISGLPLAAIDSIYLPLISVIMLLTAVSLAGAALHYKSRRVTIAAITIVPLSLLPMISPAGQSVLPPPVIIAHSSRTDILVSTPERLHIITTAPRVEHESIAYETRLRVSDYMGRRNISDVSCVTGIINTDSITYNSPLLTVGNKKMLIADCDSVIHNFTRHTSPEFILLTGRYHGDIDSVAQLIDKSTTLLIAADIHHITRRKITEICTGAGITARDLSESPFQPFAD